jgi:hypothetical protein
MGFGVDWCCVSGFRARFPVIMLSDFEDDGVVWCDVM